MAHRSFLVRFLFAATLFVGTLALPLVVGDGREARALTTSELYGNRGYYQTLDARKFDPELYERFCTNGFCGRLWGKVKEKLGGTPAREPEWHQLTDLNPSVGHLPTDQQPQPQPQPLPPAHLSAVDLHRQMIAPQYGSGGDGGPRLQVSSTVTTSRSKSKGVKKGGAPALDQHKPKKTSAAKGKARARNLPKKIAPKPVTRPGKGKRAKV
ncbi:hypothetical protein CC2G_006305 [Coprinopsis cinerea AmutBmut pab1-1]|nr:hypothetical protein CC2G_006305 [Coprinopsis cinerea AmutBmut pab1-1]